MNNYFARAAGPQIDAPRFAHIGSAPNAIGSIVDAFAINNVRDPPTMSKAGTRPSRICWWRAQTSAGRSSRSAPILVSLLNSIGPRLAFIQR